MCSAIDVANYLIKLNVQDKGRHTLTNMQLQMLVYVSHGFTLAIMDIPLVSTVPEAFPWGPVFRELYDELKPYGRSIIDKVIEGYDNKIDDLQIQRLLETVYSKYKRFDGLQLSGLTHQPGTPWTITWNSENFSPIINDLIQSHYRELLKEG